MIQRKQTLFLLLAAILAIVCILVRMQWIGWQWIDIIQVFSGVLSVYTIFIYRKRPVQARFCLLGITLIFVWYILLAVFQGYLLTIDSLPMIDAMLIFMARRGVLSDEKLVRSADRIR